VKLVITFTDRHDDPKTEGPWDTYWQSQQVSDIKVELNVPSITRIESVEQHNAFDYKRTEGTFVKPYIEIEERNGSPGIVMESEIAGVVSTKQVELISTSKDNWVRFYPQQTGTHSVSVIWNSFPAYAAYKRAKSVVARVHHVNGTSSTVYDQEPISSWLQLGTYELDANSYVDITGERESGDVLVDAIKVGNDVIPVFNRHDDYLSDGNFSLFVKDFWRQNPIGMRLEKGQATVAFITEPAIFMGGMSKTFELLYAFGENETAKSKLYSAPGTAGVKDHKDTLYFSYATNSQYDQLTNAVRENLLRYLEKQRSVGWRNWGDYQISSSYDDIEVWGNLQYDFGYGLLMLYIRTKDPDVWHLAQSAVYHLMDLDLVKFSPFIQKYNGSVHRKGEMPFEMSHVASEPIVPENFAFRSLYLYYLLTGDLFALESMKMSVDNFLEFTNSDSRIDFSSSGDRDTAWVLLGLLAGYKTFQNSVYLERATMVVEKLLEKQKAIGRLPGTQPVWQGQMIEALIKYYELTKDQRVQDAIVGHVTWLKDQAFSYNPSTGLYTMIYLMNSNSTITPLEPQWTDESNYFFLHLNAIWYAYESTKDESFKLLAEGLFQQAAKSQESFAGPRQASSFLSFPYYYLESNYSAKAPPDPPRNLMLIK
jgi:hypothetical protein